MRIEMQFLISLQVLIIRSACTNPCLDLVYITYTHFRCILWHRYKTLAMCNGTKQMLVIDLCFYIWISLKIYATRNWCRTSVAFLINMGKSATKATIRAFKIITNLNHHKDPRSSARQEQLLPATYVARTTRPSSFHRCMPQSMKSDRRSDTR
jgi:hypothetical protein